MVDSYIARKHPICVQAETSAAPGWSAARKWRRETPFLQEAATLKTLLFRQGIEVAKNDCWTSDGVRLARDHFKLFKLTSAAA
jgi:hypothetical protein